MYSRIIIIDQHFSGEKATKSSLNKLLISINTNKQFISRIKKKTIKKSFNLKILTI